MIIGSLFMKFYQLKDESPVQFLQWIRDVFKNHTSQDPNDEQTQVIAKQMFMTQASEDVKRKLKEMQGGMCDTLASLLEEDNKVYQTRPVEKSKIKALAVDTEGDQKEQRSKSRRRCPGSYQHGIDR